MMGDEAENDVEDTSGYQNSEVLLAWLGYEDSQSVHLQGGKGLVLVVSVMVNWLPPNIPFVPVSHYDLLQFIASLSFSSWP